MKKLLILIFLSSLISFSAHADSEGQEELSKKSSAEVKDCFEGLNRGIFAFNQVLDASIFEPLAKGYRLLPSPIRSGTSNFISNLSLVVTVPNNVLQGDIGLAGKNTARFVVNSTVGILGLFDPATKLGLNDYSKEDYGQTLGRWGVGEGCYLVLPVIGPSTVRDALGSLVSMSGGDAWYNVTVKNDTQYFKESDYYYSKLTEGVDFRAKNLETFDSLEKTSVDFYATVRSLYLQDRDRKIKNLKVKTDTLDDSDWDSLDN